MENQWQGHGLGYSKLMVYEVMDFHFCHSSKEITQKNRRHCDFWQYKPSDEKLAIGSIKVYCMDQGHCRSNFKTVIDCILRHL